MMKPINDPYPPRPDDGLSYRYDHDLDQWVDAMDPDTGLLVCPSCRKPKDPICDCIAKGE